MQVKTFHPVIFTSHAEDVIDFFKSIGFEIAHVKKDTSGTPNNTQLKDPNGHIVEVCSIGDEINPEEDTMMIHINVEDFEEDGKFLESKGFKAFHPDECESAKYCCYGAPTGFKINLCKHKKKAQ